MKIYFWNLNNKAEAISAIQRNSEYFENSLFAFSEFWDLTGELDVLSERFNVWHDSIHKRTGIFYGRRFQVNPESGQPYFSSYSFEYNEIFVSLYVVHLKSRMRSESTSERFAAEIRREIGEKIAAKQTEFVIIIGDFNLPYFHEHFLNLFVFNTTSYFSKKDAKHKTIEGRKILKYYNPFSSFNGDLSKGPPGTYYYNLQSQSQAWHIWDQVLISYPLAQYLDKEKCEIITEIGDDKLLTRNMRPNKKYSDHLPIKVEFS